MGKQQKKKKQRNNLLQILFDNFPDVDKQLIEHIYITSNYNWDATVEALSPQHSTSVDIKQDSLENQQNNKNNINNNISQLPSNNSNIYLSNVNENKFNSNVQLSNNNNINNNEQNNNINNEEINTKELFTQKRELLTEVQINEISFIKSLFSSSDEELIEAVYLQSNFTSAIEFLLSSNSSISLVSSQTIGEDDEEFDNEFDNEINNNIDNNNNNNNNYNDNNYNGNNINNEIYNNNVNYNDNFNIENSSRNDNYNNKNDKNNKSDYNNIIDFEEDDEKNEINEEETLNEISKDFNIEIEVVKELYNYYQKDLTQFYHFLLSLPQQNNKLQSISKKHEKMKKRIQKKGIPINLNTYSHFNAWGTPNNKSNNNNNINNNFNNNANNMNDINNNINNNNNDYNNNNLQFKGDISDTFQRSLNFSEKIKFDLIREKYKLTNIDEDILFEIFQQNHFKIENTQKALNEIFASSDIKHLLPPIISSNSLENAQEDNSNKKNNNSKNNNLGSKIYQNSAINKNTANDIHSQNRVNAKEAMEMRNNYYREAAKAYCAGNGKLAASLSQRGKEEERKLMQLNVSTAHTLFLSKDIREGKEMVRIDVHGYRVKDALISVQELISLAKQQSSDTKKIAINIITGEGYHSVRRQAKIKPALIKHFQSNRYRYRELEGSLVVYI